MIPDAARPKIARLLLLLSSDNAGEVAASAAGIGRVLEAHGCDWHDLATILTGDGGTPEIESWRAAAEWCCGYEDLLTAKERDFVNNLAHRSPERGQPTAKQCEWVFVIRDRLRVEQAKAA